MTKVVAIVGRTNVGKSTLFNRIIKKRFAVTSYEPQTTRDRLYADAQWQREEFVLVDTAGLNLEIPEKTPDNIKKLISDVKVQVNEAIKEADVLMFVVSAGEGVTPQDTEVADILRKSQKPVILVLNKVDNLKREVGVDYFLELGMGKPIPVSAISGRKSGDLLDELVKILKKIKPKREAFRSDIDVAVLGRPNVGKSTLVNQLVGGKRVLVNEVPGTTRDTVDVFFKYQEKNLKFVDTAGIRRRGKIKTGIEKFSVLRAVKSISRADISLLLIDAVEGITNQDLHIAQFILESGKGLILVVNKSDLIENESSMESFLESMRERIRFLPWSPVVFVSALTGKNIGKVLELILIVDKNRQFKVSTRIVNDIISRAIMENPPKTKGKGQLKIYFSSQVGINPPVFSLKVNKPELFHFSYLRYLEKKIREEFDFSGTPIKIELKSNKRLAIRGKR